MDRDKIVILDRDGVINEYPGHGEYVKSWDEFKFLPHAKEAIKIFNDAGFKVYVASNQAGVSKRIYSQAALDHLTVCMREELNLSGAKIDDVFYCTHKNEDNCACRKPKIGLLKKVIEKPHEHTYFVGDTLRDIKTGSDFGCKTVLVLSGKTKQAEETKDWPQRPNYVALGLHEAAVAIVNNKV